MKEAMNLSQAYAMTMMITMIMTMVKLISRAK